MGRTTKLGKPRPAVRKPNPSRQKKVKRAQYGGSKERWAEIRTKVLKAWDYCCADCGRHVTSLKPNETLQVDHIKQVSCGGTDDFINLRPLCTPLCHGKRYKHEHIRRAHNLDKIKRQNSDIPKSRHEW